MPCAAGAGRCAAASRRRDFDLLGYRYSLLAAVGSGYTPFTLLHPLHPATPPLPCYTPCHATPVSPCYTPHHATPPYQVGTSGANLVLNMLPARDLAEYQAFPPEDIAFVRRWLNWTDAHRDLVLATRALPRHGRPTAGALDGTAMLRPASCTGALFLFDPHPSPHPHHSPSTLHPSPSLSPSP